MDTDFDPSDTDYVTGLASEEDESLLEADFKQVADNPLKGLLSPSSPKKITSLVSWNCRGYRSHTDDVKDIIRQYHPVCAALQDFLKVLSHNKDTSAVAVRIHSTSLITVCCLYLPPNTVIHQHDLNNLVDQLSAPFVILGDFNGHRTLWGSAKTNPRGRQIEQNLYNSDHFPVILSHDSDPAGKIFPPTYSYCRADWALFTQLAVITDAMIKTESVDTAVQEVTNVLIAAADLSIPKVSSHSFQLYKPWWNTNCQTARIRASGSYGESFADIRIRRISWRSKRQKQMLAELGVRVKGNPGSDMCPHSLCQRPVNNYGERLRQQTGCIGNFPSLFYKPRTLSFLPQSKLSTFWVKLFRVYLVQPLIILIFSRLRGVQNVPR
ncbi:putative RNA-directed DNA polymerase from transposon X-element [Trichonephila clavipes]|nr:putative RNA-directed DNA polymerase from transposon X-element [Trichonephila clavipes]